MRIFQVAGSMYGLVLQVPSAALKYSVSAHVSQQLTAAQMPAKCVLFMLRESYMPNSLA